MTDTPFPIEPVLKIALEGERARGNGGAVWVDVEKETAKYLLPSEFTPEHFACKLNDELEADNHAHYFFVFERDRQLHISKVSKNSVLTSHCKL